VALHEEHPDPEVNDADLEDQLQPADPVDEEALEPPVPPDVEVPLEVPEADAIEQAQVVPLDDEAGRPD
jgi:hypothetical protein